MSKISEALTFGLTIRESATDGSDFTNPVADYRRLFLGEDGNLHLRDSAGTVTDVGGSSGAVATDAIWDAAGDLAVGSGANTAARLAKGAAGANLSTYNGAVAWNGGTAFPATPATGDRYWRSDLGMEFFYNGTRWLSTVLHSLDVGVVGGTLPLSATGTIHRVQSAPLRGGSDIWLETETTNFYVTGGTALGASHKWVGTYTKSAAGSSNVPITVTIDSGASDTWRTSTQAVNALQNNGTTYLAWSITWTKTGTPGTLIAVSTITYRIVAA